MKKVLAAILLIPFISGCFVMPLGSQFYEQERKSSKEIQQGTTKRTSTEYAPPISVTINVSDEGKIDAETVKNVISGVKDITQNKNRLDNEVKDKVNATSEREDSLSKTVKESILITAIGALILLLVIIWAVRWFKSTAIGAAVNAGINTASRFVRDEIRKIDDQLATAKDEDEIAELLKKKARLASEQLESVLEQQKKR